MPYARNGSVDLYYDVVGEGPPIVFAHGAGGNTASWWQQVPVFAARHTVVTFDHRGFARSHCPPGEFSRQHFVSDLEVIMDAAGIDRAVLVCQSMGGWTGLGMALTNPDRVRGLVMSHTTGGISTPAMETIRKEAFRNRQPLASPFSHWAVAPDFHEHHLALAALYTEISAFNTNLDMDVLGRELFEPFDLAGLAGYATPTLFITASQDIVFPPAMIEIAAGLVPGAELQRLGDVGHSSYFESAPAFNASVSRFIESLPA